MRFFLYGLILLNSVVFVWQLLREDPPAAVIVAVDRGVEPLVLVREKIREDELKAKEIARLKQQKIDEEKKQLEQKKAKAEETARLKKLAIKTEKARIKAAKQQAKEAVRLKQLARTAEKKRLKAEKQQAREATRLKQLAIKAEKTRIKVAKQQAKEATRLKQLAIKEQSEETKQQTEVIVAAKRTAATQATVGPVKQTDLIKNPELYCYRMGVFKLKKEVDLTLTGLNALDYSTSTGIDYSAASKFLVYLPAYPSLKAAQKATEGLVAKGVVDFQILAVYGKANGISLGVFRQHAIAEERVKEIQKLGYEPVLQAISGKLGYYIDFNKRNKFALSDEESRFLRETSKNIKISRINCSL